MGVDYHTIQYDAQGTSCWSDRIERKQFGQFWWTPIPPVRADSTGNVYLTGFGRTGEAPPSSLLVKYDGDGDELVHQRLPRYAEGRDIVLDDRGPGVRLGAGSGTAIASVPLSFAFAPDGSARWRPARKRLGS